MSAIASDLIFDCFAALGPDQVAQFACRLRLRFRNDVDDFARHLIYQKNLVFHFRIPVVGKLGDPLRQLRRKAIRLDARWQCRDLVVVSLNWTSVSLIIKI